MRCLDHGKEASPGLHFANEYVNFAANRCSTNCTRLAAVLRKSGPPAGVTQFRCKPRLQLRQLQKRECSTNLLATRIFSVEPGWRNWQTQRTQKARLLMCPERRSALLLYFPAHPNSERNQGVLFREFLSGAVVAWRLQFGYSDKKESITRCAASLADRCARHAIPPGSLPRLTPRQSQRTEA